MAEYKPDLLIAGPAFESGRYGIACGAICQAAQERLDIVAVAGMDEDNVGASLYRKTHLHRQFGRQHRYAWCRRCSEWRRSA